MKRLLLFVAFAIALSADIMAQTAVQGTVCNDNGAPMPGVRVLVPETDQSTTTDINGRFTIVVPEGTSALKLQYAGFRNREVPVSPDMSVTLQRDTRFNNAAMRPFIGVNAVVSESLYRPSLGLTAGLFNADMRYGVYLRTLFCNIPHTKTTVSSNSILKQEHSYYYGGAGVMFAICHPLYIHLGVGVSVHDSSARVEYESTMPAAATTTFDRENVTRGYMNIDWGLGYASGHIIANVGTLYECNKSWQQASKWYPYASIGYVF